MNSLFSLRASAALVTGGAGGLGFAMAVGLAEAGAELAFCCRSRTHLEKATADYAALGVKARGFVCDVTDEAQVRAMVRELGRVDILVNNAGVIRRVPMHEMPVEDMREVLEVDLVGPFVCAKAVLPGMIERGHGKIINICSMMSELGRETVSAYAAAKGGLKMLTRNICAEYGGCNIQCNAIGPGYIATEQTAPLRTPGADGTPHPFDRYLRDRTPAGRWGTPEDLVGPVVFLASKASDFVNGQVLYVDGGILASFGRSNNA